MIPNISANKTLSWAKHVHDLQGLSISDYPPEGDGVSLDDSPFLIIGSGDSPQHSGSGWHEVLPGSSEGNWQEVDDYRDTFDTDVNDVDNGKINIGNFSFQSVLETVTKAIGGISNESNIFFNANKTENINNIDDINELVFKLSDISNVTTYVNVTTVDTTLSSHQEITHLWLSTPDISEISPVHLYNETNNTLDEYYENLNWNHTLGDSSDWNIKPETLSLCILLLAFALFTMLGNGLVILAVARERYLHTVTNYFIMSLAVADCLVGAIVMPFSALYDSFDYWVFGPDFCDVWRSFDVLASTASILNLCVISLDRYWAITDPFSYPRKMSTKRACPHPPGKCPFTEDLSYLMFSSTISFYGPLFVMVFTYFRIYKAATEQTKSLKLGQKIVSSMGDGEVELTLRIHRGGGGCGSTRTSSSDNGLHRANYPSSKSLTYNHENGGGHHIHSPLEDNESCQLSHDGSSPNSSAKVVNRNVKNFSISRKLCKFAKEKKAAKTLGIVMGVFVICWLPFFVTNLLSGLCGGNCIKEPLLVGGIVTWLGWINSAMNPVIYACMARDFRSTFSK
ncbi:unnamed protein product, partial [Meganyctiphanes norvegica]